jgi:hypothetical protein
LFFLSALTAFLFTLEERYKRRRVLTGLHKLRLLAQIVDMHQLTKDPSVTRDHLLIPDGTSMAKPLLGVQNWPSI